jgi:hypothetical protein
MLFLIFTGNMGLNETLEDLKAHIRREALTILDMHRYQNTLIWIKANDGSTQSFKDAFEHKKTDPSRSQLDW